MSGIQLRANGDRAVLVRDDGAGDDEAVTEPGRLPLGTELTDALHEWAKVAAAVGRAEPGVAAGEVVSRRGLQLAGRVATSLGVAVRYVDPLSGDESVVEPVRLPKPSDVAARPPRPTEPTPWLTGLTVSAASLVITIVTVVTLAVALAETYSLLALGSNVVVTAGLLPSLWLIHRQPIWRWVAYGVAGGIALAWLALPFVIF
jgi:hypothetical protein